MPRDGWRPPGAEDAGTNEGQVVPSADTEATLEQLQAHLRRLKGQEVVNRLVSGYVHELNNQLTAIVGFGSLLKDPHLPVADREEAIDCLLDGGERARALTQRLVAITQKRGLSPAPEDINRTLSAIVPLARRALGRGVSLVAEVAQTAAKAVLCPGDVERVLCTMLFAAKDALPAEGGIRLRSVSERQAGARFHGFEVEIVAVARAPVEWTEPPHLTLWLLQDLVSQQGGRIERLAGQRTAGVTSEAGFRALWPGAPGIEDEGALEPPRRVLLIEADASLRLVLERELESMGFVPLVHTEERPWSSWIAGGPAPLFAVVDVLGNPARENETLTALRARLPQLPIIALTDPQTAASFSGGGLLTFLAKPFSLQELDARVRQVLRHEMGGARVPERS